MAKTAAESTVVVRGVVQDLVVREMERLASRIESKRRIGLGDSDEFRADDVAYGRLRAWCEREQVKPLQKGRTQ